MSMFIMATGGETKSVRPPSKRAPAVKGKAVNKAVQSAVKPRKASPKGKPASRRGLLQSAAIEEIFARFSAANPAPKGELEHVNPYTLLVAVVLSAQATDAGVNKATRALFKAADTPAKMVALGEEKVREYVKTIGLYRNKAKNVVLLSEQLLAKHNGEVPRDREALEALPGVGRKTANVVLNVAFGEPTMAVDTHVFRLANRIGFSHGKTPLAVEEDLLRLVPSRFGVEAHHWLILHGRYVCKAQKPACGSCLIRDLCLFEDKTE
jgi:endonuclease-3